MLRSGFLEELRAGDNNAEFIAMDINEHGHNVLAKSLKREPHSPVVVFQLMIIEHRAQIEDVAIIVIVNHDHGECFDAAIQVFSAQPSRTAKFLNLQKCFSDKLAFPHPYSNRPIYFWRADEIEPD